MVLSVRNPPLSCIGSSSARYLTSLSYRRFVQRAWIVLEEKKIPYQYVEINPYHKEKDFLAVSLPSCARSPEAIHCNLHLSLWIIDPPDHAQLNPRGLVPTLGCPSSGTTKALYESTIICEYLQEAYQDRGPSIYPSAAYDKARMKIWIDHVSNKMIPAWHKLLQWTESSAYSLDDARNEFKSQLKSWIREAAPKEDGPWWQGKDFSMADIVFAPWALRHWVFEHFGKDPQIPTKGQGGEDEAIWERWRRWVEAVEARDSITKLMSERQHYLPIYERYAKDKAQSEMAKAVREGRGPP